MNDKYCKYYNILSWVLNAHKKTSVYNCIIYAYKSHTLQIANSHARNQFFFVFIKLPTYKIVDKSISYKNDSGEIVSNKEFTQMFTLRVKLFLKIIHLTWQKCFSQINCFNEKSVVSFNMQINIVRKKRLNTALFLIIQVFKIMQVEIYWSFFIKHR